MEETKYTPDDWAKAATRIGNGVATRCAVWAIRSRACWVLVNGKWRKRAGLMRT